VHDDETEAYRLDRTATFARPVDLSAEDLSALRAVAAALAADPAFPFGTDLALALGKLGTAGQGGPLGTGELITHDDGAQALTARALAEAVQTRKTVTFHYTNSRGEHKHHAVDPYGVFLREGQWYLVGRDRDLDEVRTYSATRMETLDVNPRRPRTPDFERPADFDVSGHERLPFQYGAKTFTARLRFEADVAWRAERLARGQGELEQLADGSVVWTIEASDPVRLAAWIVDEGPAIHAVSPPELIDALTDGLRRVVSSHG
jgi:proteasome accessory factor B